MPAKKEVKKPVKKVAAKKPVSKPVAEVTKKAEGTKAQVFDIKGAVVKSVELPKEIFGAKINEALMTQAVLVYLANQREGSAHTKSRGEVQGSSRKVYKQKGTGRARHGSIRAPIYVGGGIAHGPKAHDFSKKLSQKMRMAALFSALSSKQKDGAIKIVEGITTLPLKTKEMFTVLSKLTLNGKNPKILLVLPGNSKEMDNVKKASRNIEGVSITQATQLNTYEVLNSKSLLFAQEALASLENHFLKKETK